MHFLTRKHVLVSTVTTLLLGIITFVYIDAYSGNKFRTMQDRISTTEGIDLTGLENLHISGGNIPRYPSLKWNLRHVKMEKIVVNAETRTISYVKGLPHTLFGYTCEAPNWRHYIRRLFITGSLLVRPEIIRTEDEEARTYGFGYKKVIIGSKFTASDKNIEEIISYFDHLPENHWLHFHCAHGSGRTSMLIVMIDIMKNAPKVALKDIVRRQHLLGSVDLFDTTVWPGGHYTQTMLDNRKKFVENFYGFICQRKEGGIQSWSEWHEQQSESESRLTQAGDKKQISSSNQRAPKETLKDS